jgi:hypothetical protein
VIDFTMQVSSADLLCNDNLDAANLFWGVNDTSRIFESGISLLSKFPEAFPFSREYRLSLKESK